MMKIGVVVVRGCAEYLTATVESLKALGCAEQNILVRHVPSVFNATMATQFFAEYTDVDAVVVMTSCGERSPEYEAMLDGMTKIQIAWNMPVAIVCDSSAAADAVEMVAMQNEMEAAAPEYTAPDRMSIN